jgi:hypothetical protein
MITAATETLDEAALGDFIHWFITDLGATQHDRDRGRRRPAGTTPSPRSDAQPARGRGCRGMR